MPYRSEAQRRWAYATGQKFAPEWSGKTHGRLPERVVPAYSGKRKRSSPVPAYTGRRKQ